MTLEEVKQRAMAIAAVDRTNVYIYQDRHGKFSTSLEPPKKHIGTFTYPYEQWEEAKS